MDGIIVLLECRQPLTKTRVSDQGYSLTLLPVYISFPIIRISEEKDTPPKYWILVKIIVEHVFHMQASKVWLWPWVSGDRLAETPEEPWSTHITRWDRECQVSRPSSLIQWNRKTVKTNYFNYKKSTKRPADVRMAAGAKQVLQMRIEQDVTGCPEAAATYV